MGWPVTVDWSRLGGAGVCQQPGSRVSAWGWVAGVSKRKAPALALSGGDGSVEGLKTEEGRDRRGD